MFNTELFMNETSSSFLSCSWALEFARDYAFLESMNHMNICIPASPSPSPSTSTPLFCFLREYELWRQKWKYMLTFCIKKVWLMIILFRIYNFVFCPSRYVFITCSIAFCTLYVENCLMGAYELEEESSSYSWLHWIHPKTCISPRIAVYRRSNYIFN